MRKIIFVLILSIISMEAGNLEKGIEAIKNGNYKTGERYIKKSCNNNEGKGCYILALHHDYKEDKKNAQDFFIKACNLNYKKGCYLLDVVGSIGKRAFKDYQKAKLIFENDCKNNDSDGCKMLALMYLFGQGVSRDYSIGKSYLRKSCDLGNSYSCNAYQKLK